MTHFPPFTFDPRDRTLRRGSTEIPLTPKAAALLASLLDARGAWVDKETILAAVWPDTHVQPENIKVLVREIRSALGDSSLAQAFIASRPRLGYAFVAPIAERPQPAGTEPMLSPRTPISVERTEIPALTAALAASGSSPRLALVIGDRGVGKTMLADAFLRTVRASGRARVCHAQCSGRELTPEPYYPLLDALARLERQYPGVAFAALAEHAPSWLALFPEWRGPGRPGATGSRHSMLDQLAAALAAMARDLPLVIVLDDVQWADAETVETLLRVAARESRPRVLFVATCHEGAWIAGGLARDRVVAAPGTRSLVLPPFTRAQTGEYIVARFGRGPLDALAPIVHAASGGNPRLIATAFDGLVERGLIAPGQDGWRRESSIAAIARALPEALAGTVERQLEQLELHERAAIEAAAAVGFTFTLGDVALALGSEPRAAAAVLGPLARRGQLVVAGHGHGAAPAAGDVYCFRHPFYVGAIARRAPQMRQRAFADRVSGRRAVAHRLAT